MGSGREIAKGVIIGVIADSIIIFASFLTNYFGLINLMNVQLPIWFILLLIVLLIPTIVMVSRFRKRPEMVASTIRYRPQRVIQEFTSNMFGVKWRILYGSYSILSEPYAFCESKPRCPTCDYEMDFEKKGLFRKHYHWLCVRCNKFYRVPQKSPYDAHEIVEKCLESDIRTGRIQV